MEEEDHQEKVIFGPNRFINNPRFTAGIVATDGLIPLMEVEDFKLTKWSTMDDSIHRLTGTIPQNTIKNTYKCTCLPG